MAARRECDEGVEDDETEVCVDRSGAVDSASQVAGVKNEVSPTLESNFVRISLISDMFFSSWSMRPSSPTTTLLLY